MIVLVCGAGGFIGSALCELLEARGHAVIRGVRAPTGVRGSEILVDFTRDFEPGDWLGRVERVDVIVNAVGILRERGVETFDALHVRAPRALFTACAQAGVKVVQISALGADDAATTRYHRSKREADRFLLQSVRHAVVAQPGLVYGPGGASARLFATLASLPLIPLPGHGMQRVQPIHIDDLAQALVRLVESDTFDGEIVELAGPEPLTLREFLAELRRALGMGPARFLPLPGRALAARALGALPASLFDTDALAMLERGNVAARNRTADALGRPPCSASRFVAPAQAASARSAAKLGWLLPIARLSLAAVWLAAGIVSLFFHPVEDSLALLARTGLDRAAATTALYAAAGLDIAFGVATLLATRPRWLWLAQGAVIVAYSAVIAWQLPEFWWHPFGPIVKNVPILALLWVLYELDRR